MTGHGSSTNHGLSQYNGPADAGTPLITTGAPPQPDHWWYLA